MKKTCFKCGLPKPIRSFYRHPGMRDGRLNKCKDCTRADVSKNYRRRRDYYIAYERERQQLPDRKLWVKNHQKKQRKLRHDRFSARASINNAIRSGRLKKLPCEICKSRNSQAHHDDYSKPLDVRWLCRKHHLEIHKKTVYTVRFNKAVIKPLLRHK